MELKISREQLLTAINIIERGLPQKTVIESLKGIKIEAVDNKLIFTTSKNDLSINYVLEDNIDIIQPGAIVIPGTQFNTIVKKSTDEEFLIKESEQGILLKTEHSKINLLQFDVMSYPNVRFDTASLEHFTMSTKTFNDAYNHTKHAVAANTIKPILSGINFQVKEGKLTAGATDARRLAISTFDLENASGEFNFTLPRNLLSDIIKIIEAANSEAVELYVSSNQIIIIADKIQIKTRLLEGDYPTISRLIPQNETYSYIVNSRDIAAIIEKVILLSSKEGSNITTNIDGDNLILSSFIREIGSLEEICSLKEIHGSPFSISFDPNFLSNAISSINETELELKMVDEVSAFSITGVKSKSNIQVISPIKLS